MQRDLGLLSSEPCDVLVIGGGINGAAVAWDCALRGFKTVLVEKGDFGAGASAGCFKIAHGGLRYLQHLDIRRLLESVEDQRILRIIAPHMIHPIPFLIPCYGNLGMKSKGILKIALMVYEQLARDRNRGVSPYHTLSKHRIISREECLNIAPGLSQKGLTGGLVYYDCQMSNCERLTYSVIRSAVEAGAKVANYAEVFSAKTTVREDSKTYIESVNVRDVFTGKEYSISPKVVLSAAGPWNDKVRHLMLSSIDSYKNSKLAFFSKGIQLVAKQIVSNYAVAFESDYCDEAAVFSRGGRSFFVHPWRGYSLIGTSDTLFKSDPDTCKITLPEIASFIKDIKMGYSSDLICPENTYFAFGHVRGLDISEREYEKLISSEEGKAGDSNVSLKDRLVDHDMPHSLTPNDRIANLVTMQGMKYTTFRALGAKASDIISRKIDGKVRPCLTKDTVLFGGDIGDFASSYTKFQIEHPEFLPLMCKHLFTNYGSVVKSVLSVCNESVEFRQSLSPSSEVIKAEIIQAARNEMVCKLSDIVFRRTALGTIGFPGQSAIGQAATLAGAELGWDKVRIQSEIEETMAMFRF